MDYENAIRLAQIRSARRRSAAWAPVGETVLGLPVAQITPATFDLLHGTGNAFVCGLPPVIADVRNFLLFHSPGFNADAPAQGLAERWPIRWKIDRAICPLFVSPLRRKAKTAASVLQAIREIRAIVAETWADSLPGNDDDDGYPTLAACLHAQLADMFAREYHFWPHPTPIRHTPLKQLFQLARCSDRHHLGSKAIYYDASEAALIRDYLAAQPIPAPKPQAQPTAATVPAHG